MIKIGIIGTYNENKERPFFDTTSFVNNYVKRIINNGALGYGIIFPSGKFDEKLLENFDGFLIPGGSDIRAYHLQTIHYAYTHNKPFLGICMGMQALGIYSLIVKELKNKNLKINYQNIETLFNTNTENKYLFKITGHNQEENFYYHSIDKSSHNIKIIPNSLLYKIYNKKIIKEPSIHNFVLKEINDDFKINAISDDGYIEGLENSFMLGVQFHPELEDKNNKLFKWLIEACKNMN